MESRLRCHRICLPFVLLSVLAAPAEIDPIPLAEIVDRSDAIFVAHVEWHDTNRFFYALWDTNDPTKYCELGPGDDYCAWKNVDDYLDLLRHVIRRRKSLDLPQETYLNPIEQEMRRIVPEVRARCRVMQVLKGTDTNDTFEVLFRDYGHPVSVPWPNVLESGKSYILWLSATNDARAGNVYRMISEYQGSREVHTNYVDHVEREDREERWIYITHEDYLEKIRREVEEQAQHPDP